MCPCFFFLCEILSRSSVSKEEKTWQDESILSCYKQNRMNELHTRASCDGRRRRTIYIRVKEIELKERERKKNAHLRISFRFKKTLGYWLQVGGAWWTQLLLLGGIGCYRHSFIMIYTCVALLLLLLLQCSMMLQPRASAKVWIFDQDARACLLRGAQHLFLFKTVKSHPRPSSPRKIEYGKHGIASLLSIRRRHLATVGKLSLSSLNPHGRALQSSSSSSSIECAFEVNIIILCCVAFGVDPPHLLVLFHHSSVEHCFSHLYKKTKKAKAKKKKKKESDWWQGGCIVVRTFKIREPRGFQKRAPFSLSLSLSHKFSSVFPPSPWVKIRRRKTSSSSSTFCI